MRPLIDPRLAATIHKQVVAYTYNDLAYYIPETDNTVLDALGQPIPNPKRIPIACNFNDKPSLERWKSWVEVSELSGEIRFDDIVPNKGAQVILVQRFGNPVNPEVQYEIIAIQDRGSFGLVCALKVVKL